MSNKFTPEQFLTPAARNIPYIAPNYRMNELTGAVGLAQLDKRHFTVNSYQPYMKEDFQRPQFYNDVFEMWGLQSGELWDK